MCSLFEIWLIMCLLFLLSLVRWELASCWGVSGLWAAEYGFRYYFHLILCGPKLHVEFEAQYIAESFLETSLCNQVLRLLFELIYIIAIGNWKVWWASRMVLHLCV